MKTFKVKNLTLKMNVVVIPNGISKSLRFIQKIFESNPELNNEDISWIMDIIQNNYDNLVNNPKNYYKFLTLSYNKIFCGFFAHIHNFKLIKFCRERNTINFINLMYNCKFEEVENNIFLTEEERNEMNTILTMEMLAINLTLKQYCLNNSVINKFEKSIEESYTEIYNKMYIQSVRNCKCNFQDFVVVTEYNNRTKSNHAYTYKLIDILIYLVQNNTLENLNQQTIDNLKKKYKIELKITENNLKVIATL